jgi:hypothetical protein
MIERRATAVVNVDAVVSIFRYHIVAKSRTPGTLYDYSIANVACNGVSI